MDAGFKTNSTAISNGDIHTVGNGHTSTAEVQSNGHSVSNGGAVVSNGHASQNGVRKVGAKLQRALHRKEPRAAPLSTFAGYAFTFVATVITTVMGATMRGDWIIILVHFLKQTDDPVVNGTEVPSELSEYDVFGRLDRRFSNVHLYISMSVVISFLSYYGMAGILHYTYYIRRQNEASEWKCQPDRWLSAENERHEMLLGSFNMALGGSVSGIIACFILNGGQTSMYFSMMEYGWWYLPVSLVLIFLYVDIMSYYTHRLFHIPFLYKHVHKIHHRYHTPTAFSAVAMHPMEFLMYQSIIAAPMFVVPVYSGVFIVNLLYGYYYGMIDHSGIMMDALWPWQPPSKFHDDHHRYFHTNFGFNLKLWDWLHDTLRQEDRIYGENVFYGKGIKKTQ